MPLRVRQDHEGLPLNESLHIKISKVHWTNLVTQAEISNVGHTTLARHWMLKGAMADGVDLEAFL